MHCSCWQLLHRLCCALFAHMLLGVGLSCFQGHTPGGGSGCDGAPLLPVLYVSMNLAYNISLLNLLRSAGKLIAQSFALLSCCLTLWICQHLHTLFAAAAAAAAD